MIIIPPIWTGFMHVIKVENEKQQILEQIDSLNREPEEYSLSGDYFHIDGLFKILIPKIINLVGPRDLIQTITSSTCCSVNLPSMRAVNQSPGAFQESSFQHVRRMV